MTDNSPGHATRRSITLEGADELRETLDRLRRELEEVRASRRRLVVTGDADRRELERELHEGVQQHLVALAVNLQLASRSADAEPAAANELLDQMGRDVQQALDETAQLAQRIYPPLEPGGLAAALRLAAASAGVRASVEVAAGASYPPEVAATVHWCWLEALAHAGAQPTVTVRDQGAELTFEVAGIEIPEDGLERLRDRVEALGGRLTIGSEPGGGTSITGSLPLREPG
jgi:signal transduction histidine kinase